MAIGWLTVLRLLPWTDIIRNAPLVADGAKKLWSAVAKKSPVPEQAANESSQPAPPFSEILTLSSLQMQLSALTAQVSDLHTQMLASSALIKALADQNTQLIKHVEANRIRLLWLTGASVVLGIAAVVGFAFAGLH